MNKKPELTYTISLTGVTKTSGIIKLEIFKQDKEFLGEMFEASNEMSVVSALSTWIGDNDIRKFTEDEFTDYNEDHGVAIYVRGEDDEESEESTIAFSYAYPLDYAKELLEIYKTALDEFIVYVQKKYNNE